MRESCTSAPQVTRKLRRYGKQRWLSRRIRFRHCRGRTRRGESRAAFSSTGPQVELAAPGTSIPSTLPEEPTPITPEPRWPLLTSPARRRCSWPRGVTDDDGNGLFNDDVRELLQVTALDLGDSGRDEHYGYGRSTSLWH